MKLFDPHLRGVPAASTISKIEPLHPVQIASYRKMSVEQKLDQLAQLCRSARAFMAAGARMRHPDWNEEQIEREVRELMLYGIS